MVFGKEYLPVHLPCTNAAFKSLVRGVSEGGVVPCRKAQTGYVALTPPKQVQKAEKKSYFQSSNVPAKQIKLDIVAHEYIYMKKRIIRLIFSL